MIKQNIDCVTQIQSLQIRANTSTESEKSATLLETSYKQGKNTDDGSEEDTFTNSAQRNSAHDENDNDKQQTVKTCKIVDKIKATKLWSNEDEVSDTIEKSAVLFKPSGKLIISSESNTSRFPRNTNSFKNVSKIYMCNGK